MNPKPCMVANRSLASTATSTHCWGAPGADRHSLAVPEPRSPSKLYLAPAGRLPPGTAPTNDAMVCCVSGDPAGGGGAGALEMHSKRSVTSFLPRTLWPKERWSEWEDLDVHDGSVVARNG